jgi:hypothetical protein
MYQAEKAHLRMLTADSSNSDIQSTGIHVAPQKEIDVLRLVITGCTACIATMLLVK